MESSADRAAVPPQPDGLNTRLLQALELGEYEELVDRVAAALFHRAMSERQTFSSAHNAHRYADRYWSNMADRMRRGWRNEARRALEGKETPYFEES